MDQSQIAITNHFSLRGEIYQSMGHEFELYVFSRELDAFLRLLGAELEHKDAATQYDKLTARAESGFAGTVKLTRELVNSFRFHVDEKYYEEEDKYEDCSIIPESFVRQQQWMECLSGDLGRLCQHLRASSG